ncbi:MAG: hypothetical protein FRX48_01640 [Lasallia pustulata]|uniref:Uncharacterized protein n=1 Tax=Lasallia pustulata TaxID=136370 RepID=A0A5M8Q0Y5_9LECA|nr:MAG: hypothetical protein FRX48_01640 [Lasallia pustulata]
MRRTCWPYWPNQADGGVAQSQAERATIDARGDDESMPYVPSFGANYPDQRTWHHNGSIQFYSAVQRF